MNLLHLVHGDAHVMAANDEAIRVELRLHLFAGTSGGGAFRCLGCLARVDECHAIMPVRDLLRAKQQPFLMLPIAHEQTHRHTLLRGPHARAVAPRLHEFHTHLCLHHDLRIRLRLPRGAKRSRLRRGVIHKMERAVRDLRVRFADDCPCRVRQCFGIVGDELLDVRIIGGLECGQRRERSEQQGREE